MSSLNVRVRSVPSYNAAGTAVKRISPEAQLTRLTLAHMLWENQFYVDGVTTADRIKDLVTKVPATFVANLAKQARTAFKLRHVPLLLMREQARSRKLVAEDLNAVIQRPDEMSEFLSLYWQDGKVPLSNQVKKGLASAFSKFNEYNLAKWDKNSAAVSLRDVMFLTHPKPANAEQEALFKRVANQELATPDTWETQLSAGADKGETFARLMAEGTLGALAFLRNLRNMTEAGIDELVIRAYAKTLNVDKVLPFRFIAAARIVPQFEDMLEEMMFRSLAKHEKLPGKTILMIDMSGSMFNTKVSAKSDLDRIDAALALAVLCREICEEVEIYTFNDNIARVLPRRGFALIDAAHEAAYENCKYKHYGKTALRKLHGYGGTSLGLCLRKVGACGADRTIVFTDEQSYDTPQAPATPLGYILNVASYENGVNHKEWVTITGFSEAVIDYIKAYENTQ